ncbi:MAG: PspC domain-containing protein [Dehalococcoidia bacterium]
MTRKLYRSRNDRMIWGVCGGLGTYFGIDPTIIRIAAVVSIFFTVLGLIAYLIMAIVVPLEDSEDYGP